MAGIVTAILTVLKAIVICAWPIFLVGGIALLYNKIFK